ncbi:unnamed protein product [Mytilus edulis]|uniref:Uncharacterized protein n=1 Tax=Mytilus edulis TaxID=6550 RepID=A0A8S3V8R6_MYTED|nr:unnamed protein product [Mytilus edulis]
MDPADVIQRAIVIAAGTRSPSESDRCPSPSLREIKGYALPSFCLISTCLAKVREENSKIMLITPVWQSQAWYTLLLQMSVDYPVLLPMSHNTLLSPMKEPHPLILNKTLKLAGWTVSGDHLTQLEFQSKLKNYSLGLGNREQDLLTTVPGISGLAGVTHWKLVSFQHLWPLS